MAEEINFDEIFEDKGDKPVVRPEDIQDEACSDAVSEDAPQAEEAEPAAGEFFEVQHSEYNEAVRKASVERANKPTRTENQVLRPEEKVSQPEEKVFPMKKQAIKSERQAAPAKKLPPKKEKRKGSGLMYFLFVISVSVILTCLAWMAACDVLGFNGSDEEVPVTLSKSSFTEKMVTVTDSQGNEKTEKQLIPDIGYVADQLKDAGVIKYKWLFRLFCNFTSASDNLSPGTYVLRDAYDYRALLMKMQSGSSSAVTIKITFPEGYSMEQMFRLLEEQEVCDYADLMDAAANGTFNYDFLEGIEKGDASRLEGYLFPDTYEFYKYMPAASVINKFLEGFHYKLTAEMLDWQAASGYSWDEIVTVASMIEKEAANDSERYLIASVIYNRLKAGWPLQIDSTTLYEYPDHKGAPTAEMLAKDSPYNTRINTGLPPTAICSPGIVSIKAALDPSETNYMFYALDTATGEHRFFSTADEFDAFVATQNY